uniref:Uncharacterized protein n=1 Tax=Arundo donax TaxID=35708 RepID=A0A0A9A935_ARUDO
MVVCCEVDININNSPFSSDIGRPERRLEKEGKIDLYEQSGLQHDHCACPFQFLSS